MSTVAKTQPVLPDNPTQSPDPKAFLTRLEEEDLELFDKDAKKEMREYLALLFKRASERAEVVPRNLGVFVKGLIKEIDDRISLQLSEVLHAPEFQAIEGTWRGLQYLMDNSELEANRLEVQIMDISKDELAAMLKDHQGIWDQSPLFDQIYLKEFDHFGGRPFGCLVGDYHFNQSVEDVETLEGMARIAAAAYAPFISGADPKLFGVKDWRGLEKLPELKEVFTSKKYLRWNKFREDNLDSRFIGLTMPRILAREPWGEGGRKVKEFDFQETVKDHH